MVMRAAFFFASPVSSKSLPVKHPKCQTTLIVKNPQPPVYFVSITTSCHSKKIT